MDKKIFVSTNNFKTRNLVQILNFCQRYKLYNIELGPSLEYNENIVDIVFKCASEQFNFILHHYFPKIKNDFVLNLASANEIILNDSINFCKTAIDISSKINAPFYSFHAGFAFDPKLEELGKKLKTHNLIPKEQAYEIFLNSVKILSEYAKNKNVSLLIENNVIAPFNLANGKNETLLLSDTDEINKFFKEVGTNIGLILDFGHMKVSCKTLGINEDEFFLKINSYIRAFHLSDNDGYEDLHLSFDENVWFAKYLKKCKVDYFVIEAMNLNLDQIISMKRVVERILQV